MPETCPHCGAKLPMVVDVFCPECRKDLSEPPATWRGPPPPAETTGTTPLRVMWFEFLAGVCLVAAVVKACQGDRDEATRIALISAPFWLALAAWTYWSPFRRHRVEGTSKVRKTQ